jgi:hypothetical protein
VDLLRAVFATTLFCISSYLIYDLFANGFSWPVLIFCISGYIIVHYIWPKNNNIESDLFDIVELVIDIPYRTIALILRSIGKVFRGGDSDIGIDL